MTKLFSYLSVFLLLGGLMTSCLDDEVEDNAPSFGFLPAVDVAYSEDSIQPATQVTKIHVTFNYSNSCQEFLEFRNISSTEANESKVGVFAKQENSPSCTTTLTPVTKTFQFRPRLSGPNVLKFWAGKDAAGQDIYITDTINVPE